MESSLGRGVRQIGDGEKLTDLIELEMRSCRGSLGRLIGFWYALEIVEGFLRVRGLSRLLDGLDATRRGIEWEHCVRR